MKNITFAIGTLLVASQAHAFSYFNDFESPVGAEWNVTNTAPFVTTVLGRLSNGAAQLTLTGLTVGEVATIKFDFFALDSLDGSATSNGPDRFVFDVDGAVKLDTTFSNVGFNPQNYPDVTGGANFAFQTGADDVDLSHGGTLPNGYFGNSVYRFGGGLNPSFSAVATSSTMVLTWTASGLQDIGDESWALDNVSVQTDSVPEPAALAVLGVGVFTLLRRRKTR